MQRLYIPTPFSVISYMIFGLAGLMLYSRSFWMPSEGCGLFGFAVVGVIFVGFIMLILDRWVKKTLPVKVVWILETVILLVCTFGYWA